MKGTQFALRYPVSRPGGVTQLRAFLLCQIGQVLQAYALAALGVAGGARKIMRPAAKEKHLFAQAIRLFFPGVIECNFHHHAFGFRSNPRRQRFDVRTAAARAEDAFGGIRVRNALQRSHAMHEPRFEIHDAICIGEVARQFSVCTLHHAHAFAKIALFQ